VRVLIVDGSARVRTRLADRLTAARVEVLEAADMREAQRAIGAFAPDAVLLDVHLDAETGVAALARVRQLASRAIIVALTNEATEVHRRECIRHGADFFFDKSVDFDRAVELVIDASMTRSS
jgi:DNA-binding response OmpR family regulator